MKRFAIAVVLTCAMTSSALAGDIPTDGSPAPAPQESAQATNGSPGEIPSGGIAAQLSEAALSALMSVLGLLG